MKVQLINRNVWDLVNSKEVKPPDAPAEVTNADGAVTNQAGIIATNFLLRSLWLQWLQAGSEHHP